MNLCDENSTDVKPLTKRNRQGELYYRREDTQTQLELAAGQPASEILKMLAAKHRDDDGFLLDESIIYFIREAHSKNERDFLEKLYGELSARTRKLLLKFRNGFNSNGEFDDFAQTVELAIIKKIFDLETDAADFAQVNFGSYVILSAKGIRKQNLAVINRENELFETVREGDEDENRLENLSSGDQVSAEELLILREGIAKLSNEHIVVAAMLAEGFQIESKDENEPTISRHLNVSSRTIRNWIKEMRETLKSFEGDARK